MIIILSSFALFYLVCVLLLYERETHFGPFESLNKKVCFIHEDGAHYQPVALFDRIRALTGIYKKEGNIWYVKRYWVTDVWTCPTCLSMWVAMPISVFLVVSGEVLIRDIVIIHFALAGISTFLHQFLDKLDK